MAALPVPARTAHPRTAHHRSVHPPARRRPAIRRAVLARRSTRPRAHLPAATVRPRRRRRPAPPTARLRNLPGHWAAPRQVFAPVGTDLIGPVLAIGSGARVAVGSGTTNEESPGTARASVIDSVGPGFGAATPLPGIEQTLAADEQAGGPALLVGASPGNVPCCSTASVLLPAAGGFAGHQMTVGLQGPTAGALVNVRHGLVAAVANQSGVSFARIDPVAGTVAPTQLLGVDPTPPVMALTSTAAGGAALTWTAPAAPAQTVTGTSTDAGTTSAGTGTGPTSASVSGYDQPANGRIDFVLADPTGKLGAVQLALTVPAHREIDALAIAAHGHGTTLAWTETWFSGSRFRSQVFWSELRAGAIAHPLSAPGSDAVGVSLAAAPSGRQVLAWQACSVAHGTCRVAAALRSRDGAWGPVRDLGGDDPTGFPVAAISRQGEALVAWIAHGVVYARPAGPDARSFLASHRVSAAIASRSRDASVADGASALALSFGSGTGPDGQAEAAWLQGTVNQQLLAARFTP